MIMIALFVFLMILSSVAEIFRDTRDYYADQSNEPTDYAGHYF